jgi:tryptophanyl-tRNA synthetase
MSPQVTPQVGRPDVKVSLTGIKPTGEPHLGNFIGAIRPGLELAKQYESMYFIADYHALTTVRDAELMHRWTRSVAATWLAAGLDPDKTIFYRQSDVPEIFELTWMLSCVTAKGLMNRAHAYKAAVDRNRETGKPDDDGVNMGVYGYPVLMAADILIMETDVVPVGKDQVQHVEYAADIAGSFNHLYGKKYKLKVPEPVTPDDESGRTLPGVDGRKMSKSYDNTIPLFVPEGQLKKLVRRIPTDSTPVDEPKDPDSSAVFQILEQFAAPSQVAETRKRLEAGGMGWGELKDELFEVLNELLTPLRARYDALMEPNSELDALLAAGADRARQRARPVLEGARAAVGAG